MRFDRRYAVAAGIVGRGRGRRRDRRLYANQSSIALRREQIAAADLARQAQQIQSVARESQNETRRLASAIETLNSDRDRLYSRVTVAGTGLDSVTGAIARQGPAATPPQAAPPPSPSSDDRAARRSSQNPAPLVGTRRRQWPRSRPRPWRKSPPRCRQASDRRGRLPSPARPRFRRWRPAIPGAPAAVPAAPLVAPQSIMAPPDAAAGKLIEPRQPPKTSTSGCGSTPEAVAAAPPAEDKRAGRNRRCHPKSRSSAPNSASMSAARIRSAGLRALWRGPAQIESRRWRRCARSS